MKTRKFDRKLFLRRETVANLDYEQMRVIYAGGDTNTCGDTNCATNCHCSKTILTSCCK